MVLSAVSDHRVATRWDDPSVLAEQTIGSLAGHLARGSVWALVIACGAEIGRQRHGGGAMIRTLFRTNPDTLPVL